MSNSEQSSSPRAFVTAFIAGIACSLLVLIMLLVVVDPVGTGNGNILCEAGAKTAVSQYVKPGLPAATAPHTAVIGTSRAHYGFDSTALGLLGGPAPAVSLGIDASLPNDWAPLGDDVLRNAEHPMIFLGADFNAAFMADEERPGGPIGSIFARLRGSWLGDNALRALPGALPFCQVLIARDGTPVRDADGKPLGWVITDATAAIAHTVRTADMAGMMDERLAQTRVLIHRWRSAGATVVVFSAPYRGELLDLYRTEGAMPAFAQYHARLHAIANQEGAAFVDFNPPEALVALDLSPCPDEGIGCHYFDIAHYRPEVARAMAPHLRRAATQLRQPD